MNCDHLGLGDCDLQGFWFVIFEKYASLCKSFGKRWCKSILQNVNPFCWLHGRKNTAALEQRFRKFELCFCVLPLSLDLKLYFMWIYTAVHYCTSASEQSSRTVYSRMCSISQQIVYKLYISLAKGWLPIVTYNRGQTAAIYIYIYILYISFRVKPVRCTNAH